MEGTRKHFDAIRKAGENADYWQDAAVMSALKNDRSAIDGGAADAC